MVVKAVSKQGVGICWFRRNLRLHDNQALNQAAAHEKLICLYSWQGNEHGEYQQQWLAASLQSLAEQLEERGQSLVIAKGDPVVAIKKILDAHPDATLFTHRIWEEDALAEEERVQSALAKYDVALTVCQSDLLFSPEEVYSGKGTPFKVFTPFWRACCLMQPARPVRCVELPAQPSKIGISTIQLPATSMLDSWGELWRPGEVGALQRWQSFKKAGLENYDVSRDLPGQDGTSRLSAHLHFGEISPRHIWYAVRGEAKLSKGATTFLNEIGWREFAAHLLYHFPHTVSQPLREEFKHFPWHVSKKHLTAWQQGMTGYPLIDAGMRQLLATGWMHNRVRMNVASFLVKHLRIHWLDGASWFWNHLVDADLASNTLGWQWSAGCGADAAPYFRIFNPVLQGEKFDPDGDYVKLWCPELARLPAKWVHQPWAAPAEILAEADIALGVTYPRPIVDHVTARQEALDAFASLSKST